MTRTRTTVTTVKCDLEVRRERTNKFCFVTPELNATGDAERIDVYSGPKPPALGVEIISKFAQLHELVKIESRPYRWLDREDFVHEVWVRPEVRRDGIPMPLERDPLKMFTTADELALVRELSTMVALDTGLG
jgi:hypothetical protein